MLREKDNGTGYLELQLVYAELSKEARNLVNAEIALKRSDEEPFLTDSIHMFKEGASPSKIIGKKQPELQIQYLEEQLEQAIAEINRLKGKNSNKDRIIEELHSKIQLEVTEKARVLKQNKQFFDEKHSLINSPVKRNKKG